MGAQLGDQVLLPLDFSQYLGDSAVMKLFAIMVAEIEGVHIDLKNAMLHCGDIILPLEVFGITPDTFTIDLYYTLKGTYRHTNGKLSVTFNNAAFIDCHYVFDSFVNSLEVTLL